MKTSFRTLLVGYSVLCYVCLRLKKTNINIVDNKQYHFAEGNYTLAGNIVLITAKVCFQYSDADLCATKWCAN